MNTSTREYQLILSNDGASASGIPQVYDLTFNPDTTSANTYVFAEPNPATCEPASICAKVANEGHVLPQPGNLNYRQILHGRQERRRSIQRLKGNLTGCPSTERLGGMFMPGLARPKAFVVWETHKLIFYFGHVQRVCVQHRDSWFF